jgi:hypothetical protein
MDKRYVEECALSARARKWKGARRLRSTRNRNLVIEVRILFHIASAIDLSVRSDHSITNLNEDAAPR